MDELRALRSLARALGVHTRFTDGLGKRVTVAPETLVRVCAALGAPVAGPADGAGALRAVRAAKTTGLVPPVLVAWDGVLAPLAVHARGPVHAELQLEDGAAAPLEISGGELQATHPLPAGYHRLTIDHAGARETCTVISAPTLAWRRPGSQRSWGVGARRAVAPWVISGTWNRCVGGCVGGAGTSSRSSRCFRPSIPSGRSRARIRP